MSANAHLEVEAKFAVDEATPVPDFTRLTAVDKRDADVTHNLSAVYYDTPDLRLTRAKITLRRRTGGKDDGWHIKLPNDGNGRRELHAPLEDPGTPPAELINYVRAIVRGENLIPIAQVDNHRVEQVLIDEGGQAVAEFCDDHVTAWSLLPGGQQTSWREWEVELTEAIADTADGAALLHEATTLVINAGGRKSNSPSKLAAALGDSVKSAPTPPVDAGAELDEDSPAAAVIAALREQRDKLIEWDPKVRDDEWDSVHQMRVATRELRSLLETFEGILVGDSLRHLESELKELAALLGTARDAEVVEERFNALLDSDETGQVDDTAAEHIRNDMRHEYEAAHRKIVAAMNSPRYLAMLDAIDELLANPPLAESFSKDSAKEDEGKDSATVEGEDSANEETGEDAPVTSGSSESEILFDHLEKAYKKVAKRHKLALEYYPDTTLPLHTREDYVHDVRKAAKKLRYSANAAKGAGLKTGKLSKACKQLQEVLGDFQDAVTSRDRIEGLVRAARERGEDTFAYGILFQREIARGDEALKGYSEAMNNVRKEFKDVKPVSKKDKKKKKKK
ncbi:CYTH and CHAD domain-containing protein [Corynebacterium aquatimens]|uniref:CHAD domain-containing protein n=1 Tax=Corynebacterium aquatimens TaxID=1190508 RepID=A0A931E3X2_9CORY|nr:CYTH and CHAD domain-containing protein [Corynebacterium aquatimens]MBG6122028.1 CHAD domain-containing protein [Corynebacterium aquatimens]WJY65431.1 CHAD domain protein [Corynebacterium aquatimens]